MAFHLLASLNSNTLANCLASIGSSDSLLLLGDGVYVLQSPQLLAACRAATGNIYVLAVDQQQRLPNTGVSVPLISNAEWVEMSLSLGPVVSWY